jgi:rod shape-determining protein MreD
VNLIIAAAAAVVAALAEITVAPNIRVGGATMHPVLVLGVSWVIVGGLDAGMVWAFVGGLVLDVLGQRPLGSTAFTMLLAIGLAAAIGRALGRVRVAAPVIATAVTSVFYSLLLLAVTTVLTDTPLPATAIGLVPPSALYDSVLALLVGPLAIAIVARLRDTDRVTW